jgi:hypothetical protein
MRISRRTFGTLVGAVLLAGCGKTAEVATADRLKWLRVLDGVEKVELVDEFILVTLRKGRCPQPTSSASPQPTHPTTSTPPPSAR